MSTRMGVTKRTPAIPFGPLRDRFAKLSKADWADAYVDLYRQVFGEDEPTESAIADAERRTKLLAGYRAAEGAR